MSLMKDLNHAIMAAAVGVMASYSTVSPVEGLLSNVPHQQSQEDVAVSEAIHALIKKCKAEEQEFLSAVKVAAGLSASEIQERVQPDQVVDFTEYLHKIRSLEVIMKGYEVPEQFAAQHMDARRAMAKFRSSAAMLHMIILQAVNVPSIIPGHASADGLKMLAEHTTAAVVGLAKA
ncbi:hypothetical protein BVH03_08310 [Pseudomonas sp. PA15(2017)]|uniref:hypothetical protein n=1 Tax=Pseudomonas sp. PA15(2017) TaxID=1932111 RepID=UPI000959E373|nr:hypothetical protein [Pseudomonas sp. PA15(2017)]OLU31466.1 hypothetical protein BVH03_08310 [Pseudomonas sp. PA15(2017)]